MATFFFAYFGKNTQKEKYFLGLKLIDFEKTILYDCHTIIRNTITVLQIYN